MANRFKNLHDTEEGFKQWKELYRELQEEHDRAAAITAFSYFEARLEEVLKTKFVSLSEKEYEELLSIPTRAKLKLAYALGVINQEKRKDLEMASRVRHSFAHSYAPLNFESPEIKNSTSQLVTPKTHPLRQMSGFNLNSSGGRYLATLWCIAIEIAFPKEFNRIAVVS